MAGEEPSAQDAGDAFLRLQDLMESWQTERLTIPYVLRTTWTITSVKGTLAAPYTVGVGGDINVIRPASHAHITGLAYQNTSLTPVAEIPLDLYTDDGWRDQALKNQTGALPVAAYYNPTYAAGFGSLYLTPIPSTANLQGVFYAQAPVAKPVLATDVIILPAGYFRFIRDNLALELAPEFRPGLRTDPLLIKAAADSKANIKNANFRTRDMSLDPALVGGGGYDIETDR